MQAIQEYLNTTSALRAGREQMTKDVQAALRPIQVLGQHADDLLSRCELAQVQEPVDRHLLEEMRQTLGALSRESWKAHEALRVSILALHQLAEVEARVVNRAEG